MILFLIDIYFYIVLLRLLLQYNRASYYNPICRFVSKASDFLVIPLRKIVRPIYGWDMATVIVLFVIIFVKIFFLVNIAAIVPSKIVYTIGLMAILFLINCMKLLFYVVLMNAIMSWVPSLQANPIGEVVSTITNPLLSRVRQVIPPFGMIDLSPLIVFIGLYLVNQYVLYPTLTKMLWQFAS